MGRGGGCVTGKLAMNRSKRSIDDDAESAEDEHEGRPSAEPLEETASKSTPTPAEEAPTADAAAPEFAGRKLKIFVVYYSTYGHIATMARKVKEGVDSVDGVQGYLYQVPETLSEEVLWRMQAPAKDSTVPIISAEELPKADGLIFGFPTRFGAMAAQMKAFFDTTGELWKGQLLAGKPAGFFVSTGTPGGGQETTAWTAITQLAHHGMLFVPIGYTFGAGMFILDEVRGGSPYGAGTYAGDGTRIPSETELSLAKHQGKYTAGFVKRITGGQ